MAEIAVGESATAGLRLIARRPLSVLTWGLLASAYVVLIVVLFGGGVAVSIMSMVHAGSQPKPEQIFGVVGSLIGAVGLLWIGLVLIGAMIQGAAFRAELEPERSLFAFLRLGRQELWIIAVNFVLWVVLTVAQMILSIPINIIGFGMGIGIAGFGGNPPPRDPSAALQAMAGSFGAPMIGGVLVMAVLVWLWLRLSMGVVMSFQERQFRLFESWNLTKGHAWRMFLTMLVVFLILFVLQVVAWTILAGTFGATIMANADLTNPQSLASLTAAAWISRLTPVIVVLGVLMVAMVGIGNAMTWGAVAHMYRQLRPSNDVASTFA